MFRTAGFLFKDATKIKLKDVNSKKFVGAKTLKLKVRNYLNSTMTFPTTWRCAGDFLKVLLKFKIAATVQNMSDRSI